MSLNSSIKSMTTTPADPIYSPVALNPEWPKMGRLLFMVFSCTLGSIMNGFFISSFFVERNLRTVGNVFHACAGLADFMITAGVMPVSAVVLLSGQWESELLLCHILQVAATASTYCYNIFFVLIAIESLYRILRTPAKYKEFRKATVATISILVFVVSFITAVVGVYYGFDYHYCTRYDHGNYYFKVVTAIIFQLVPSIFTTASLIYVSVYVRRRARKQIKYKRSQVYENDNSITALNLTSYLIFVACWIPYIVIVHEYPSTTNGFFYHSVWFGLYRSVFGSVLYAIFNRNFRRAFACLFNYFFCKNTLSLSYTSRHRRVPEYRSTFGDIRVHIMHQAIPRYNVSRQSRVL